MTAPASQARPVHVVAPGARVTRLVGLSSISTALIVAAVLLPAVPAAATDDASVTPTARRVARLHPAVGDRPHTPTRAGVANATSRLRTTPFIPGATRALLTCQADLILADRPTPDHVRVSVVVDTTGRARAARVHEPRGATPLRECLLAGLVRLRLPAREEAAVLEQSWDLRLD